MSLSLGLKRCSYGKVRSTTNRSIQEGFEVGQKARLRLNELFAVVEMLANDIELPEKHHNHLLHGDYNGYWECHINPDWLLLTSDALFVSNSAFFMKKRK